MKRRDYRSIEGPANLMEESFRRVLYLVGKAPPRVQIEITNRCNLKCPMCPREIYGLPRVDMPFELYLKILDRLHSHVRRVTLVGWGEPLLHPKFIDMVGEAKRRGLEVQSTTNGISLDEEMAGKIVERGLDFLAVSVDDIDDTGLGHKNRKALKNIERLVAIRGDSDLPFITFQTTMHKGQERAIYDVIKYAGSMGADRVFLIRLDKRHNPELARPSFKEELRTYRNARKLGREAGVQVEHVLAAFSGLRGLLYRHLRRFMYRFDRYCPKTFDYIYITVDGDVTPCCALPRYGLGNIFEEALEDLWQGEKFRRFRKNMPVVCGACDFNYIRPKQ